MGDKLFLPTSFLRSLFQYDKKTGFLCWRSRADVPKCWNTRYAGTEITGLDRHGYIQVRIGKKTYRAHRVIWAIVRGEWPINDVDHRNGMRNDNRWRNLRSASRSQNNHNRSVPSRAKLSKGVCIHKKSGLFRAYTCFGKKQISFGYYKTPEAAAKAYALCAPEVHGEFYRNV
jgi:hypothetical protein